MIKDIVFDKVGDIDLTMDMIPMEGKKNSPAVIFIHGGGWEDCTKEDDWGLTEFFARIGYVSFSINYRLTPVAPFPAQIEDCKAAVRHIRANADKYGVDPENIFVCGLSAGGHLASLLGVLSQGEYEGQGSNLETSSAVKAVLNYVGPNDFSYYYTISELNNIRDNNFRQLFERTSQGIEYWITEASPITHVSSVSAPQLVMYGTVDELVPYKQGYAFEEKMKENNVYCEFYIEEGSGHGLNNDNIYPIMEKFLKKYVSA